MARLDPLTQDRLAEFESVFADIESSGNIVPNSMLTMGRAPGILHAYVQLSSVVFQAASVSAALKRMLAHVASRVAGMSILRGPQRLARIHPRRREAEAR
jgi:hypothetical protein